MQNYNILWADDEIDLLKAHIIFLEQKGFIVTPVNNGVDALEEIQKKQYDCVFLDENMPGMTGLELLPQIKNIRPNLPVVMITKSEEESIMEEAIGSKITDYLIKPLRPQQIVLCLKKIFDNSRLVSEKTNTDYQREFQQISLQYNEHLDYDEWANLFQKLVRHELKIDDTEEKSMMEVLQMQKTEANRNFCEFVEDNYEDWLNDEDAPLMSHQVMKEKVLPEMKSSDSFFLIVIDNLRLDQWEVIEPLVAKHFSIEERNHFYSILPTATQYARNALFSGLTPLEISKKHPQLWVGENDEGGKNNHEDELLETFFTKEKQNVKFEYNKILTLEQGQNLVNKFNNLLSNEFNAIVFNFVDMLSHARTDMKVIKELAANESAYRSITKSWFEHSSLFELLKKIAQSGNKVIITTDHGTTLVKNPFKIVGDKAVNTNLRYKQGRNLGYEEKGVFTMYDPEKFGLPKTNISSRYVFTKENDFFVYPNNYNKFVSMYKDTFQHGGISMEEMIIPLIKLSPK